MAFAPTKDASASAGPSPPETVEAIDRALDTEKVKLAEASAARDQCRERRKKFAQQDDKQSYLKEKRVEDELDFEVESSQAKIDKLNSARPIAFVREAAERLNSERAALTDRVRKFQKGDLKKIEEAIAFLSEALPREADLYRDLTEFNDRSQPARLDPIESPEVSRHLPAVPARQDGTRKVRRSRIRGGIGKGISTAGGPDRYETYEADEPVIIPEVPEFKPGPLFLRIIVSSFHRDGPHYIPPGMAWPWHGR
jgi:hypothetical protein